jgi:hypothetical protein
MSLIGRRCGRDDGIRAGQGKEEEEEERKDVEYEFI